MFLSAVTVFQSFLKSEITDLKKCERYKGEFEDNGNWTAEFPCALWRLDDLNPTIDSAGKVFAESVELTLHTADKSTTEALILNTIENISAAIKANPEIEGADVFVRPEYKGAKFKGYVNGVEVYVIAVSLDVSSK
jgi:hypothetical protein